MYQNNPSGNSHTYESANLVNKHVCNTVHHQRPLFKVFFLIFSGQNFEDDIRILQDLKFCQEFKQTFGQKGVYPTKEKYAQTA